MTTPVCEILLTPAPLEPPPPHFSAASGGVVDFYGVVRGQEENEQISGIEYEAHADMARHQLDLLCQEALERFPLHSLILHHRTGYIPTATPSLFVRTSAAHRGPAFEAAEWIIVQLKLRVPIWKHPLSQNTGEEVPHPNIAVGTGVSPGANSGAIAVNH